MEYYVNEQMKHLNLLTSELDKAYHEAALKLGLSDSVMLILYTLCWCEGECLLGDLTSSASIPHCASWRRMGLSVWRPFGGGGRRYVLRTRGSSM